MAPPSFPSFGRGTAAKRMQPAKRYRPGKPIADEVESSEEEDEEEEEVEEQKPKQLPQSRPPPSSRNITSGVRQVKLEEEAEDEEGFVTEEEEDAVDIHPKSSAPVTSDRLHTGEVSVRKQEAQTSEVEDESEEESGSEEDSEEDSEEESSSEDEGPRRLLLRPTFIKKGERKAAVTSSNVGHIATSSSALDPDAEAEELKRRKDKADLLIRDQLEKDAAARIAGRKTWDDDIDETGAGVDENHIDDTDGVDPAAELAAWKLRELKRVKREREAIEVAEKEREEIERRRNLTTEEREREDREFIDKQKEDREAGRGKAGFMQRYFHKGAFFQPDSEKHGLTERDLMGGHYVDEIKNREALPEYLQVRDATKIGRKGRTKYRDLKTEDTGRWGVENYYRSNAPASSAARFGIKDERFLPDSRDGDLRRPSGPSGANASAVKERRRPRSRSRSPRRRQDHLSSRSRSPPRRDQHRDDDGRSRRKRSPSPYHDRDKRRRVDSVS
ncbi:microfibril-associated protein [Nannizzia gypsea CBS 118893]|uniref:Microfibril-associated protein n=1 Tax=Arthroderma gypseum (strain ATCC MYA-4604 / CBS 118893) TaxID=535722 RepID=E4V3R1_ARTGP|nr:microfibril-associated protein [Nannizzia gypsea CBS 118893]EFR04635.1 microfibril-associated protein [Nannizzia gypsea CBS 118893]